MQDKTISLPPVFPVACHTDYIGIGSTFVAIKGMKDDGILHILTALQKGATTIVVTTDAMLNDEITQSIQMARAQLIRVDNTRKALAELSAQAAGHPAKRLKLIAITGTKGKTTSSFLLAHILESAGYTVALLSTVGNRIKGIVLPTTLTTAQPDYLHQFFKLCVENGVTHVIMEVAAQAVSLYRVYGLTYDALLFTNFSKEHGEFYSSMSDYFSAKAELLNQLYTDAPALINGDDNWCKTLLTKYKHCFAMSMNIPPVQNKKDKATLHQVRGTLITQSTGTVQGSVKCCNIQYSMTCPALVGTFNAYNCMGVIGIAHFLGLTPAQVQYGFSTFEGVPGRLARYQLPNGSSCYIDYAHNPSSYRAVLDTLHSLTNHLIVVFGAGGDRDKTRRPDMGAIAAEYANILVITSDNPRSENPAQIIEDICAGVPPDKQHTIIRELDREKAIKKAYSLSRQGTIIVLLGKGTDEYQIIGKTKTFFSEAAIIQTL